jgi:hypothetical protein
MNNIYGVDIDRQAVEVTKLSLLLKVLEGENEETISKQLKLFQERALPDLSNNIKCGNSLIGWDILKDNPGLGQEEIDRINPFDWEREFPEIMQSGGFHAIIGNPPYVRSQLLADSKDYFKQHYNTYSGIADLYICFIEQGILLLKDGGVLSYIVANKWMRAAYGKPLRLWLKSQNIEEITDFGDLPIFKNAATYPCILRVSRKQPKPEIMVTRINALDFANLSDYVDKNCYPVAVKALDDSGWSLAEGCTQALLSKMQSLSISLQEYVDGKAYLGVLTGLDKVFIIDKETKDALVKEDPRSASLIRPFLMGKDIKRYITPDSNRYLVMMPSGWTRAQSGNIADALGWLKESYSAIANYLLPFAKAASARSDANRGEYWWELRACNYYGEFEKPKIMYDVFQTKPSFTYDDGGCYANHAVWIIPESDKYLLGILNSRLGWLMVSNYCTQIQSGYQLMFSYLGKIPIRTIDFSNSDDIARHDRMVALVEQMLALHKQLPEARTPHEQTALQRRIEATDREIDSLVYELYGLTEDEIRIVEGTSK